MRIEQKIVPGSGDVGELWRWIWRDYTAADGENWIDLAMLTLQEAAGWPVERIALAFDCRPERVQLGIATIRTQLLALLDSRDVACLGAAARDARVA